MNMMVWYRILVDRRLLSILERMKQPPKFASRYCLAEADDGELYVPCKINERKLHTEPWWDRPLNHKDIYHYPYVFISYVTGWVVWMEFE